MHTLKGPGMKHRLKIRTDRLTRNFIVCPSQGLLAEFPDTYEVLFAPDSALIQFHKLPSFCICLVILFH